MSKCQNLTLSDKKIPDFDFPHRYQYSHTLVDTQEKTLGSFQPKLRTKIEVISQKLSKTEFLAKWQFFEIFRTKQIPNFEFSHGYHYSHTLIETKKTLGSFQPKLMTKIEVISQKPSKNWIFGKNGHFLTLFGHKFPNFEFSHGYHYSHTLVDTQGKTLGSFQPKLRTKIKVISQKPLNTWSFGKK